MKRTDKKEIIDAEVVETKNKKRNIDKQVVNDNIHFKRIGAYFIDMFIITLLVGLFVNVRFLNPHYEEYKEASDIYQEYYQEYSKGNVTSSEFTRETLEARSDLYKYGVSNYVIALVTIFGYLVVFQKFNNGQTIGKKLFKIKVVDIKGDTPKLGILSLRIIPMFIYGYAGIFSILASILFPLFTSIAVFTPWISAVTIANSLLGLIDAEFLIARKDKRALHDVMCNTKVVTE